jgi:hypothetical protein
MTQDVGTKIIGVWSEVEGGGPRLEGRNRRAISALLGRWQVPESAEYAPVGDGRRLLVVVGDTLLVISLDDGEAQVDAVPICPKTIHARETVKAPENSEVQVAFELTSTTFEPTSADSADATPRPTSITLPLSGGERAAEMRRELARSLGARLGLPLAADPDDPT